MPYIDEEKRPNIYRKYDDDDIQIDGGVIFVDNIDCAGDLQYAIAVMIKTYMEQHGLNYQHCNDVMGALAGAQVEFYRRTVAPYEDKKIEENGDV